MSEGACFFVPLAPSTRVYINYTHRCDSHFTGDLRNQLDNGISELIEGKHESALKTFANIVTADPLYGEAWNKKATVHYMMGHTHNSIECAQQALEIDELNFQALAGMGLLDLDASRYDRAINNFKKALKINPWLGTVASRLAACIVKKIQH